MWPPSRVVFKLFDKCWLGNAQECKITSIKDIFIHLSNGSIITLYRVKHILDLEMSLICLNKFASKGYLTTLSKSSWWMWSCIGVVEAYVECLESEGEQRRESESDCKGKCIMHRFSPLRVCFYKQYKGELKGLQCMVDLEHFRRRALRPTNSP
jgi:hypothetical protein